MSDSTDETGPPQEVDQSDRDKLMSKAYTTAQKDLRLAHKKEFDGYYQARCAELGIQWTPRRSKEEVALDQITELLSQYPDLAAKLAEKLASG